MEFSASSLFLVASTVLAIAATLLLFEAVSRIEAWALACLITGGVLVAVPAHIQAVTLVIVAFGVFALLHAKEDNATMTIPVAPGVLVSPLLLMNACVAALLGGAVWAELRGVFVAIVATGVGMYLVVVLHKALRGFTEATVGAGDFLLLPVIVGVPGLLAHSAVVVLYALLAAQFCALVHAVVKRAKRLDRVPALPGLLTGSLAVAVAAAGGLFAGLGF